MKLSDHSSTIAKINMAKRCFATNERFRLSKLICEHSNVKNMSLEDYQIQNQVIFKLIIVMSKEIRFIEKYFIRDFTSAVLDIFGKRLVSFGESFIIRNIRRRKSIFWWTILYLKFKLGQFWTKILTGRSLSKTDFMFWTYDIHRHSGHFGYSRPVDIQPEPGARSPKTGLRAPTRMPTPGLYIKNLKLIVSKLSHYLFQKKGPTIIFLIKSFL